MVGILTFAIETLTSTTMVSIVKPEWRRLVTASYSQSNVFFSRKLCSGLVRGLDLEPIKDRLLLTTIIRRTRDDVRGLLVMVTLEAAVLDTAAFFSIFANPACGDRIAAA
jgi:hypothetical protein